jgi:tetratricopeptide (TPR) repeat protein
MFEKGKFIELDKKILKALPFIFAFILLATQQSFAQFQDPKSAIDNEGSKKTKKVEPKGKTKPVSKSTPKPVVKKTPPPEPKPTNQEVLREITPIIPVAKPTPKPKVSRAKKRVTSTTVANTKTRGGSYIFILPEAGLEVLVDEQKQGKYADENAEVQLNVSLGKHRFIIRRNGQPIGDAILNISKDKKEINLSPYINEGVTENNQESQDNNSNEIGTKVEIKTRPSPENPKPATTQIYVPTLDEKQTVLNKIIELFDKYKDYRFSDKITVADWEYVYEKSISPNGLPENLDSKIKNAFMSFASGQIYLSQNRYKDAIREFSNAVTMTSLVKRESATAHFALANAYRADKNYDEARKSYERSIKLDDKMTLAYKNLADMLYQNGSQSSSVFYYLKAIELGYGSIETNLKYANSLRVVERYDEAIKVYEKVNSQTQNSDAYLGLAECYYNKKFMLRAVDALQKSIEINPNNIYAIQRLGAIYFETQDYDSAISYLQKALDLDKDGKFINLNQTQELLKKAKKKNGK